MENYKKYQVCADKRKCFAAYERNGVRYCRILDNTLFKDKCPFCKPYREFTKGVWYRS